MSTAPTSAPRSFVTSSKTGTLGQCFRSTSRGNGSISQKATVRKPPVRSRPSDIPPIPLKRSSTVITASPSWP